jgi:peptidyl-prolyl cis-trans isomerase SurA
MPTHLLPTLSRLPALRRHGMLTALLLVLAALPVMPLVAQTVPSTTGAAERRSADYIVAVVNRELVTNAEVRQRVEQFERQAARSGGAAPNREVLLRDMLDTLIDERAQLSLARETLGRIEEHEVDRAVSAVAAQNQVNVAQLRDLLRKEGMDYQRFRQNLRDQMLLERVRDRDVQARIRISDSDIENWLQEQRRKAGLSTELNIAQILITLPDGASAAQTSERRLRAVQLLQRLKAGEDFAALVAEASEGNKTNGGQLGLRAAERLPDLFVEAVTPLKVGEVAPQVLRSGAGFHLLQLVERKEASLSVQQQHSRHILLRPGPKLSQSAAIDRLEEYKRQVEAGRARFEDLARRHSEDGSAQSGGDLGWAGPGQFVPEFEEALARLQPQQLSSPVVSRFGVHLIQLLERRQVALSPKEQRESARSALREAKYEEAYTEWARETRARAYVELRDSPSF